MNKMPEWKRNFYSNILQRGKEYYQENLVKDLEITNSKYTAIVIGNENYRVKISRINKKIIGMECTCLFAASGEKCKHMAAVLFAVENAGTQSLSKNQTELIKLIRSAPDELLRKFLTEKILTDKHLSDILYLYLNQQTKEKDLNNYKAIIKTVIETSLSEYNLGYENYYIHSRLIADINEFAESYISVMIEKHMYEWSFELTKYIISETLNYDINEIDDFIYSDIASICKEILEKILKNSNGTAIENEIYEWAIKNISDSPYDELYKSLLKENFGDEVYLRRKLQFIENKISSIKAVESDYPSAEEYEIVPLMVYKLNLMKKLGYDDTETQKIKSEYISYPEIRKIIINEFIDNSEYEKAIDLLIETREKDANSKRNVYDYTVRLKNLYKITGNIDGLKKELLFLIINYGWSAGFKDFFEYKSLFSHDEWLTEREYIISSIKSDSYLMDILFKEKLYDRLIEIVISHDVDDIIKKYESTLKHIYPEKLFRWYESYVNELAKKTGTRKHYRQIAKIIENMKTYPDSDETVQKIVNEWTVKYSRRPTMMDELRKSGMIK